MSAISVFNKGPSIQEREAAPRRARLTSLNSHWAGLTLFVLVNLFILVQLGLLWRQAGDYNDEAMAEQRMQLRAAQIAAVPLRGLDAKLTAATSESDRFYRERLPQSEAEMLAELGALTKKTGVRLTRVSYSYAQVLAGSQGALTEARMDATLSGDYRPLVTMLNSLERDRTFFLINAVQLTGQQTGNVSLRLRLTTYLRPAQALGLAEDGGAVANGDSPGGPPR